MEKAILFFDIDGTILSEKTRKIPESAVTALQLAKKAGHLLFINTGKDDLQHTGRDPENAF